MAALGHASEVQAEMSASWAQEKAELQAQHDEEMFQLRREFFGGEVCHQTWATERQAVITGATKEQPHQKFREWQEKKRNVTFCGEEPAQN